MKMTNTYALSVAIQNLNSTGLYDTNGVNILSDEDCANVIQKLEAMIQTNMRKAESAKSRERKPSAKEIARKEEMVKFCDTVYDTMKQQPNFLYECKMLADTMNVSTPKMAHVLAYLVEVGKVERIEGKKPNFKVKGE